MSDISISTAVRTGRVAKAYRGVVQGFAQYNVYRVTLSELQNLSDRELADLGIHRSQIRSIAYNAAYAA